MLWRHVLAVEEMVSVGAAKLKSSDVYDEPNFSAASRAGANRVSACPRAQRSWLGDF
jgi:hypothetical protein